MTRGFALARRGTFVSAKVPKAICPAVDVQGCTNAASAGMRRSGLRPAPKARAGNLGLRLPQWVCRRHLSATAPALLYLPTSLSVACAGGRAMYRDVRVPRVQDAYERPSATLILGSTEGAKNNLIAQFHFT